MTDKHLKGLAIHNLAIHNIVSGGRTMERLEKLYERIKKFNEDMYNF